MLPIWFKTRSYHHFDWPIANPGKFLSTIRSPDKVAQWAFYPFIRFDIKTRKYSKNKGNDKKIRPILYASHADSNLYAYYASKLSKKYEALLHSLGLSTNILAYRKLEGRCNIDFSLAAFKEIAQRKECCAIAFDIEKFFDRINHKVLKNELSYVLSADTLPNDYYNIYKSLTRYSYIEKDTAFDLLGLSKNGHHPRRICTPSDFRSILRKAIKANRDKFGIPQGSPLSGLLANISLLNFDVKISAFARRYSAVYFRYSDDILVICKTQDKDYFTNLVDESLGLLDLKTNGKTKTHYFSSTKNKLSVNSPLQYLGFMFDGSNIYVRSSSIVRYQSRLNKKIKDLKKSQDRHNKFRERDGLPPRPLFLKQLLSRNTHFGQRNFVRYGLRAAKLMNSPSIKRQFAHLTKLFFKKVETK